MNSIISKEVTHLITKYGSLLSINTNALRDNYLSLQKIANSNKAQVACVLKNNAYGLGLKEIGKFLASYGCKQFFVATFMEGIALRKSFTNHKNISPKIYILHGLIADELPELQEYNLIPVLNTLVQVMTLLNFTKKQKKTIDCILHVETGMNRLGLTTTEIDTLLTNNPTIFNYLNIEYIISHLACGDIATSPINSLQLHNFQDIIKKFPKQKYSLVASYGTFLGKEYLFDLIRPGFALYGGNPTPTVSNPMKAVIELYSIILQIKTIKKGEGCGYGYIWNAIKDTKTAIVSIGYADGILRHTKGKLFIAGIPCPIIGRISMDLINIDISHLDINLQQEGTIVEIIGNNQSLDDIAEAANTIHCEASTYLTKRYPRIFLENNSIIKESL